MFPCHPYRPPRVTCPAWVLPPPEEFTAALLEEAVKDAATTVPVACPAVDEGQAVIVVATWSYIGSGYQTTGEAWLANSAAARAREERRIAKEERRTLRRTA